MSYYVKEENGKFAVYETGYKSLKLDLYETEAQAKNSIEQWDARDKLSDKIRDFLDAMMLEFGSILPPDEIREMMKEA